VKIGKSLKIYEIFKGNFKKNYENLYVLSIKKSSLYFIFLALKPIGKIGGCYKALKTVCAVLDSNA
jgi:hypothetical protein